MKLRRCAHLFVELDCQPRFEFITLLNGGDGFDRSPRWLAYAAHLDFPVVVSLEEMALLQAVHPDHWIALTEIETCFAASMVARLLNVGLLVGDDIAANEWRERDERVRAVAWWPPAAIAHRYGRWQGVDTKARIEAGNVLTTDEAVGAYGEPPSHDYRRRPSATPQRLDAPLSGVLDGFLDKRKTCRNYAADAALDSAAFATFMRRVWGAVGQFEVGRGTVALKKTSPAGGGLHCVEAYVLVQRVAGVAPGLYHYLCTEHALESLQELSHEAAGEHAHRFVAGQHWFAAAPVLVVMTARFDRLFWKYRRHAKAWRVAHLDAGHLSQTMFLTAAELGLGAFVTAAVNDHAIERALELETEREGVIAVCGFGPRAAMATTLELDDLQPTVATRMLGAAAP